jgi:hypothetical protein
VSPFLSSARGSEGEWQPGFGYATPNTLARREGLETAKKGDTGKVLLETLRLQMSRVLRCTLLLSFVLLAL